MRCRWCRLLRSDSVCVSIPPPGSCARPHGGIVIAAVPSAAVVTYRVKFALAPRLSADSLPGPLLPAVVTERGGGVDGGVAGWLLCVLPQPDPTELTRHLLHRHAPPVAILPHDCSARRVWAKVLESGFEPTHFQSGSARTATAAAPRIDVCRKGGDSLVGLLWSPCASAGGPETDPHALQSDPLARQMDTVCVAGRVAGHVPLEAMWCLACAYGQCTTVHIPIDL